MKIELYLNNNELSILKKSIDIALNINFKTMCDNYVNELYKKKAHSENISLCKILTDINKQIKKEG